MKKEKLQMLFVLVAMLALVSNVSVALPAVELLTNGDFESGLDGTGNPVGWTVLGDMEGAGPAPTSWALNSPPTGTGNSSATSFRAEADTSENEVVLLQVTDVTFVAGETYTLSFDHLTTYAGSRYYLSGNIGYMDPSDGTFQWLSVGYTVSTAADDWVNTDTSNYYGELYYTAIEEVAGLQVAIEIRDYGHMYAAYDAEIDNVSLMGPVPEPATIALLSLGGLLLRRKK